MVKTTPWPLYPQEITSVPTEKEAARAPELIWMFRRTKQSPFAPTIN
jgi:hypothetical protein